MSDKYQEWMKQANYDMDTADVMFSSGRYFYAVFMCHLAIEKALKSLFQKLLGRVPPKTHNLLHLLNATGKQPDEDLVRFLIKLNTASVSTRYPDELEKTQAAFTREITKDILMKGKDLLLWIKAQF